MKMRSKMLKFEKGQSKPTANRAEKAIINDEAMVWIRKIDAQNENNSGVEAVLRELVVAARNGLVSMDTMEEILLRRPLRASIASVLSDMQKPSRQR